MRFFCGLSKTTRGFSSVSRSLVKVDLPLRKACKGRFAAGVGASATFSGLVQRLFYYLTSDLMRVVVFFWNFHYFFSTRQKCRRHYCLGWNDAKSNCVAVGRNATGFVYARNKQVGVSYCRSAEFNVQHGIATRNLLKLFFHFTFIK